MAVILKMPHKRATESISLAKTTSLECFSRLDTLIKKVVPSSLPTILQQLRDKQEDTQKIYNSLDSQKAKKRIEYKILELCKEEDKKNLIEKYGKTPNIEVNIIDILQNIVQKYQNENCFKNVSSFAQLKINSLSDK